MCSVYVQGVRSFDRRGPLWPAARTLLLDPSLSSAHPLRRHIQEKKMIQKDMGIMGMTIAINQGK